MNLNELEEKIAELKELERQASKLREELGLQQVIEERIIPETCCDETDETEEGTPLKDFTLLEFL